LVGGQLDRRVSAAELARELHMSESSFRACFKQATGLLPINYLVMKKMQTAMCRLIGLDDPVTRIAMDLGFSSTQNFATAVRADDAP